MVPHKKPNHIVSITVLHNNLTNITTKHSRNYSLSTEHMLRITLMVYTTGGILISFGDVYGASMTTVCKVVANVALYIVVLSKNTSTTFKK